MLHYDLSTNDCHANCCNLIRFCVLGRCCLLSEYCNTTVVQVCLGKPLNIMALVHISLPSVQAQVNCNKFSTNDACIVMSCFFSGNHRISLHYCMRQFSLQFYGWQPFLPPWHLPARRPPPTAGRRQPPPPPTARPTARYPKRWLLGKFKFFRLLRFFG